jgi:hypothetical protein
MQGTAIERTGRAEGNRHHAGAAKKNGVDEQQKSRTTIAKTRGGRYDQAHNAGTGREIDAAASWNCRIRQPLFTVALNPAGRNKRNNPKSDRSNNEMTMMVMMAVVVPSLPRAKMRCAAGSGSYAIHLIIRQRDRLGSIRQAGTGK